MDDNQVQGAEIKGGGPDEPNYWRCRADNARIEAAVIDDPKPRSLMNKVALGYDLIADRVEQRANGRALSVC